MFVVGSQRRTKRDTEYNIRQFISLDVIWRKFYDSLICWRVTTAGIQIPPIFIKYYLYVFTFAYFITVIRYSVHRMFILLSKNELYVSNQNRCDLLRQKVVYGL